ncbi:MAG: hypothetical protein U9R08_01025 [Nanoarchaeota archaeon]|nr:hypothetical protein [Nanoarchaeota archaeon]
MVQPPKDYETSPEKYPNIIEIKPKTLCTFNPSSTWIKRFFHIPYTKGELDSSVAYVPVLYSENPYVAKSYKAQLDGIVDEKTKRRLRDGD